MLWLKRVSADNTVEGDPHAFIQLLKSLVNSCDKINAFLNVRLRGFLREVFYCMNRNFFDCHGFSLSFSDLSAKNSLKANVTVHWRRTRQGEVYSATAGSPHYNPFPLLVVQFNLNRSPQRSRRVELFPAAAGGTKTNSLWSS